VEPLGAFRYAFRRSSNALKNNMYYLPLAKAQDTFVVVMHTVDCGLGFVLQLNEHRENKNSSSK
jgi:hypothetical protein